MKKSYLLPFIASFFSAIPLDAQQWWQLNGEYFQGNTIRTIFYPNGSMFWNGVDGFYQSPYNNTASPSTILSGALWLGVEDGGTLRVAGQTFGLTINENDYYIGPLNPLTGLPYLGKDVSDFNHIWTVQRYEILQHIDDFGQEGRLDNPVISVVGWPGHGNPYFHIANGFDLRESPQGSAPFYDRDGDGIYNAFKGDYPLPEAVDPGNIPEQMIWMVFNDAGGPHLNSGGAPLGVEVQRTAWAFSCDDNPVLNNTIFISHKIINRSGRDYRDVYAGIWTNFDIGCFSDDYVGCIPDLNVYYGYNGTPIDGEPCYYPYPTYNTPPLVQAVTLLNQPMNGFQMFNNQFFGEPIPATTNPYSPQEYFNYLTLKWKDGTPLTSGGNGYNPGSTGNPIRFAFPDDPNDPTGWSQFSQNIALHDVRGLGVAYFDHFKNGEAKVIDVAYSTHRDPTLNHVQQVGLLYEEIPLLRQMYTDRFENTCSQPPLCTEDCVWPGDANNDGIANHLDLLAIGAGFDSLGMERSNPFIWSPTQAEDWNDTLKSGLNFKHLDCNGDGHITREDWEVTLLNFGKQNADYTKEDVYRAGSDLFLTTSVDIENNVVEKEDGFFTLKFRQKNIPKLASLAFTLEFDTNFFSSISNLTLSQISNCPSYLKLQTDSKGVQLGEIYFSTFGPCILNKSFLFSTVMYPTNKPLPSISTILRFKNIRAVLLDGTEINLGGQNLKLYFSGFDIEGQEQEGKEPIIIYPNPSDGVFYVRLQEGEIEIDGMRLYDARGRLVDIRPEFRQRDFMLDLRHLAAGVYFLQVTQGYDTMVRKLAVGTH